MTIVSVLVAWGCLAVGFLIGWLLGRSDWANRHRQAMSTEGAARGKHHALTSEMPAIAVTKVTVGPTDQVVRADTARDTPVPRRRVDDHPDVPTLPPQPGGRRRSDGPRQTRRSASQLAEGKQGVFGRFGPPPDAEDPDSP